MPDRHGADDLLPVILLQPARRDIRNLGIEHDVEVCVRQPREIGRPRIQRGHHIHIDAELSQQARHLDHVIAMAEAQRRRPENIAAWPRPRRAGWGAIDLRRKRADQLVERLRRAPVFLFLIRRQVQRDYRDRQLQCTRQPCRVILDQLRRA